MTVKNLPAELYEGEGNRVVVLNNWTDVNGDVIDWTTATALTFRVTSSKGGGTTIFSKTLADSTETATTLTIPFAASDMGANATGLYWWELSVNFGSGLEQIVAPSPFHFKDSAT